MPSRPEWALRILLGSMLRMRHGANSPTDVGDGSIAAVVGTVRRPALAELTREGSPKLLTPARQSASSQAAAAAASWRNEDANGEYAKASGRTREKKAKARKRGSVQAGRRTTHRRGHRGPWQDCAHPGVIGVAAGGGVVPSTQAFPCGCEKVLPCHCQIKPLGAARSLSCSGRQTKVSLVYCTKSLTLSN